MYKQPSTPAEVKLAVVSDWRDRDVTYMDVANRTGYRYPTICNIMANKKAYFTPRQAERLAVAFGYNPEYLILGKGALVAKDKQDLDLDGRNDFMSDGYKITFLLRCIKDIGEARNDDLLQLIYLKFMKAITTADPVECAENIFDINEKVIWLQVESGKTLEQIEKEAIRIPSNLWNAMDVEPPKDNNV